MAVHKSRRSILSLKSWLFTPATKADRFDRAAEVHADALIIDLEDAVALPDKQKARTAALQYLGQPAESRLPCALRINAPCRAAGRRSPFLHLSPLLPAALAGREGRRPR